MYIAYILSAFNVIAISVILSINFVFTALIASAYVVPGIKNSTIGELKLGENSSLLVQPQHASKGAVLMFVYLHGLTGNCHEPFIVPPFHPVAESIVKRYSCSLFLSDGYGSESWGNNSSLAGITKSIREVSKSFNISRIIMIGSSMGAGVALNYAATAPNDIKEKIIGVVAFAPTGDLKAMYNLSKHSLIRPTMITAFGGTPEQVPKMYSKASFLDNLDTINPTLRVCIVSLKRDGIHPNILQEEIVHLLKKINIPVVWYQVNDNQPIPPIKPYLQGVDFILNASN